MRYYDLITGFLSLVLVSEAKYIISLKKGAVVSNDLLSNTDIDFFEIGDYSGLIVNDESMARNLGKLNYVESIEEDLPVSIEDIVEIDVNYQWGLDRIDQPNLPLNKNYDPPQHGDGTYIYVCDTGVRKTHIEFQGRVEDGYSHYGSKPTDGNGHGTHVMSTVIGKTVGVSNKAMGVAVKVLTDSGSGTWAGVIKGIEWSVKDIKNKKRCGVISMSLGGGKSTAINNAVNAAVRQGVNVVVAAGNNNGDACFKSPASAEKAITVGSTTSSDGRSYFSNHGKCVDIFAPGSYILGASNKDNRSYKTLSGTSMACPHVSGALAMLFKSNNCKQQDAVDALRKLAVQGKIKSMPTNTDNLLLQVENINPTPTPSPTTPCIDICKAQKNENSCVTNSDCDCIWKNKECNIAPPTPKPTPSPTIDCALECKPIRDKCECKLNKRLGGDCECKWNRRRRCNAV